jgi:hypothetical protein
MWLPGHLALSTLVILPVIWLASSRKIANQFQSLAFLFFFSVFPDFLHIADLRIVTHSILGLCLFVTIIILLLWKVSGINCVLIFIAITASGLHLFGDWLFGHFYPFFPLSLQYFSLNNFNTLLDMRTELLLLTVMLAFLLPILKKRKSHVDFVGLSPQQRKSALLLMILFISMNIAQTALFFKMNVEHAATLTSILLWVAYPVLLVLSIMILAKTSKEIC